MIKEPTTKANVGKPPKKSALQTALQDAPAFVADNMNEVEQPAAEAPKKEPRVLVDMNFKVDPDFRKRVKMASVQSGITVKALFEEAFADWVDKRKGK